VNGEFNVYMILAALPGTLLLVGSWPSSATS
jgi:hypothetical protein